MKLHEISNVKLLLARLKKLLYWYIAVFWISFVNDIWNSFSNISLVICIQIRHFYNEILFLKNKNT